MIHPTESIAKISGERSGRNASVSNGAGGDAGKPAVGDKNLLTQPVDPALVRLVSVPGVEPNRVGAFFDIDETLVRGASSFWAAKEMFLHHFFGITDLGYAAFQTLRFVLFGENLDRIEDFTNRAAALVAGSDAAELRSLGEEIFDRYFLPNAYRATLDRLRAHVAAGHQVFLASATPWLIAEVFAKNLGAAVGLGTRLEVDDAGKLVAQLNGPVLHGAGKMHVVCSVASERGISLADSWAYSDSSADISLLSQVGHPVAVNPDPGLYAYASLRNWEVLRARTRADEIKRRSILFGSAGALATLTGAAGLGAAALWKRKFRR